MPRIVPSRAAMPGSTWPAIKLSLPRDRVVGGTGHGEEVFGAILEQDRRDCAFGQNRAKQVECGALGPDPVERGAPVHRHAQALAALLDHGRSFSPHVDPQDDVRDAAAQFADIDLGSFRKTARLAEIVGCRLGGDFVHLPVDWGRGAASGLRFRVQACDELGVFAAGKTPLESGLNALSITTHQGRGVEPEAGKDLAAIEARIVER